MATITSLLTKLPRMWTGTKTQYNGITTKDQYTLYFITDTQEIYKGSVLFSDASSVPANKMDKLPSTTGEDFITLTAGTSGDIKASDVKINKSTLSASSTTTVPTDKTVKDYIDTRVAGGTAGNIAVVASGGTKLTGGTIKAGGATLASTPVATTLASEAAVNTAITNSANTKVDKFNGTNNNIVLATGGTASGVKDAGVSIGGGTLGNSSTKVAREDAVSTELAKKMNLVEANPDHPEQVYPVLVTLDGSGGQAQQAMDGAGYSTVIDSGVYATHFDQPGSDGYWGDGTATQYALAYAVGVQDALPVRQYVIDPEDGNHFVSTVGTEGHVVVVGGTAGRPADIGITIVSGTTSANTDALRAKELATTKYVDAKATASTTDKMDKLATSTAGHLVTAVGGTKSNVQDASVALNTSAAFSGGTATVSTDDKIKTYIDTRAATSGGSNTGAIAVVNGTTGLAGSGVSISTSVANNDTTVPTGKAVQTYVSGGYLPQFKGAANNTIVLTAGTGTSVTGSTYTISTSDTTLTGGTTTVPTSNAIKSYVDGKIGDLGNVFNFLGTKATKSALPASGNKTGDVWIVTADETYSPAKSNVEYVWTGTAWEELGGNVDPNIYTTKQNASTGVIATFVGGTASDIQSSGKTISTSVNNNDTTIPTGKAVTTAITNSANTKVDKFNGTAGHIVTAVGGTASNVQDSNVSINSGTLGTATSTVPTDKTVYDEFVALIEALAWQEPT